VLGDEKAVLNWATAAAPKPISTYAIEKSARGAAAVLSDMPYRLALLASTSTSIANITSTAMPTRPSAKPT